MPQALCLSANQTPLFLVPGFEHFKAVHHVTECQGMENNYRFSDKGEQQAPR